VKIKKSAIRSVQVQKQPKTASPNAEIIPMLKKTAEDPDQVVMEITRLTDDLRPNYPSIPVNAGNPASSGWKMKPPQ
jgi:hypothetical protein